MPSPGSRHPASIRRVRIEDVPDTVRAKARVAGAEDWLEGLPGLVAELLDADPYARATWLAARTGLDPAAIWEWGVVERVSTGLVCAGIDLQPVAREMLAAADTLARL